MLFTKAFLAAAVQTLVKAAQITNSGFSDITTGTPFTITWSGATSGVTLLLKNGPPTNLITVSIIGSDLSGDSYSWIPSSSLVNDIYAIEIDAPGEEPNYSEMFPLNGGTSTSTSAPDPLLTIPEPPPAEYSPNSDYVEPPSYNSPEIAKIESRIGVRTNVFGQALPYDHYHVAAVPVMPKPNGEASGLATEKVQEGSSGRSVIFCCCGLTLLPFIIIGLIIVLPIMLHTPGKQEAETTLTV